MFKNISAIVIVIFFAIELYLASAGNQHKKKKLLSGWNQVPGRIVSIEKKTDEINRRTVYELQIETESGRTIYAKEGIFCIYEEGESVLLQEKDGYHKLLGNDRVGIRGKKELFWGLFPVALIVAVSIVLSILF